MLLIPCPWCGARDETEFTCGGEAHIVRPRQPQTLSDDVWADFLFMRRNTKGVRFERWWHSHGCRRWFNVARHTASDGILAVYRMGEEPPELAELASTKAGGPERRQMSGRPDPGGRQP